MNVRPMDIERARGCHWAEDEVDIIPIYCAIANLRGNRMG